MDRTDDHASMAADAGGIHNTASGTAEAVVQAGVIHGDVHIGYVQALALHHAHALTPDRDRARTFAAALAEDIAVLDAVVTDFTGADLTEVDLRGINLNGIRWSALTTHWPPEWQDAIREASVRIDPEGRPDLYEIRDEPRVPLTFDAEPS